MRFLGPLLILGEKEQDVEFFSKHEGIASPPQGIPIPNWKGESNSTAVPLTLDIIHLPTRRLRIEPTAIGRRPPPFFSSAISREPAKNGLAGEGTSPAAR